MSALLQQHDAPGDTSLRRAFIAFHLTLGLGLFYASMHTVMRALTVGAESGGWAVATLAAVEAAGALLFLVGRTVRVGGALLLLTLGLALIVHSARMEVHPDLLVYAAGTLFVMVHGGAMQHSRDS